MTSLADTENKTPKPRGGVQPKKQAPKGKLAVKMRRKKIIAALVEGKTLKEAGIIGGLSPKTAATQVCATLQNPTVQNALKAEMEKIGMDDDFLAMHLKLLIEGKKLIPTRGKSEDGVIVNKYIEVPDNQALARGLELAYKVKGAFAAKKHDVNVKRPLMVVIRRFSEDAPPDSPTGGATP
jgi:phage terminase small subunit